MYEEPMDNPVARLGQAIAQGMKAFNDAVESIARTLTAANSERMKHYPALLDCAAPLAREGWFLSKYFGITEVDELAYSAKNRPLPEVAATLAKLYAESLDGHAHNIARDFPEDAFAVLPAVAAHTRGEYALSVPVFLARAEGICFRYLQAGIFHGRPNDRIESLAQIELASSTPAAQSDLLFSVIDVFYRALWTSVSEKLPLAYTSKEREEHGYSGLNRNTILHGIAMEEYATEENSLKAFSFLSCIAALAPMTFDEQHATV